MTDNFDSKNKLSELAASIDQGADKSPQEDNPGFTRYLVIGLGVLIGTIVIGFLVAVVGGAINSDGIANFFRILRDFFIIVLALQGILISVALVILILQLSSLINLLRNEIKPIVDETRLTLTTIRGTTQFVSRNLAAPVIKAAATVAGIRTFFGEIANIRSNLHGRGRK